MQEFTRQSAIQQNFCLESLLIHSLSKLVSGFKVCTGNFLNFHEAKQARSNI